MADIQLVILVIGARNPVNGLATGRDKAYFLAVLFEVFLARARQARSGGQIGIPGVGFLIVGGIGGNRGQSSEIQLPVHGDCEHVGCGLDAAINIAGALVPVRNHGERYGTEIVFLAFKIRLVYNNRTRLTVEVAVLVLGADLQRIGGQPAETATGIEDVVIAPF